MPTWLCSVANHRLSRDMHHAWHAARLGSMARLRDGSCCLALLGRPRRVRLRSRHTVLGAQTAVGQVEVDILVSGGGARTCPPLGLYGKVHSALFHLEQNARSKIDVCGRSPSVVQPVSGPWSPMSAAHVCLMRTIVCTSRCYPCKPVTRVDLANGLSAMRYTTTAFLGLGASQRLSSQP